MSLSTAVEHLPPFHLQLTNHCISLTTIKELELSLLTDRYHTSKLCIIMVNSHCLSKPQNITNLSDKTKRCKTFCYISQQEVHYILTSLQQNIQLKHVNRYHFILQEKQQQNNWLVAQLKGQTSASYYFPLFCLSLLVSVKDRQLL